ncbi:MAG: hypothetical protein EAZ16_14885 [Sphingobacteriales bacterium]|nr:MAG: hypothetical protein EAZ16_14885 [Sphingobacteriales bacterium]
MSVLELKNELHRLVVNTEDENILERVRVYFSSLSDGSDWWETLSPNQKTVLETGLDQLDSGQKVNHHAVREKVNQLLKDG